MCYTNNNTLPESPESPMSYGDSYYTPLSESPASLWCSPNYTALPESIVSV